MKSKWLVFALAWLGLLTTTACGGVSGGAAGGTPFGIEERSHGHP